MRFHVIKREGCPVWKRIAFYVLAVLAALVLGGLLLLFGVGGLTGSLSQGEAAQAQAEDRSRQAKARMYDVLTGVLFAMTLLSLVGAAITQAAGFVALLLVSASLLGVAWIGYLVAALHGGKKT